MKALLARTIVIAFVAAILPMAAGVTAAFADWELVRPGPGPSIGCLPPDVKLPTPDGQIVDMDSFRGKVVLMIFCSGYTDSCFMLVHTLNSLLDRYEAQGLVAPLIVSELPTIASRTKCADIIGDRFPTLFDTDQRVKRAFAVKQLPTTFVVGRDFSIRGRIRGRSVFYTPEFHAALEELLAENP